MIGHSDQFDSIGLGGTNGNFVIFDNVRVVTTLFITSVALIEGGRVQIDFVAAPGQSSNFRLQSSSELSSASWVDENTAVPSTTPQGLRFAVPRNGDFRFYRIRG